MAEAVAFVSSIFAPAAGTAAAGAAVGTAAAGAAAGGGFLQSILGGVISGMGAGMMKKAEYREEERQKVAEEQRAEESYAGIGEATRFDNEATAGGGIDPDYQRADAKSNFNQAVGQQAGGFDQAMAPGKKKPPRYRYDPQTRSINYA